VKDFPSGRTGSLIIISHSILLVRARSVGCSKTQPVLCHTGCIVFFFVFSPNIGCVVPYSRFRHHSLPNDVWTLFFYPVQNRTMPKNRKIDREYLATGEQSIISKKLLAVNKFIWKMVTDISEERIA